MKNTTIASLLCAAISIAVSTAKGDEARDALHGVWQATSVEANGQKHSEDDVARTQFSFVGSKLFIRGRIHNKIEACSYSVNAKESPHHLDFTTSTKVMLQAIYELDKDKLTICIRDEKSKAGRPTEFVAGEGSDSVLMVFRKEE